MAEHEGIWSEYRPTYWDGWSAVKRMGDLVRCRDCKYCMSYWKSDYCDYFSHVTNNPDGFCAWGERKEVAE